MLTDLRRLDCSRMCRVVMTVGVVLLPLLAPPVSAQRLTGPVAPEGSVRSLSMGNAVVALGGDAGTLVVNPANVNGVGSLGASDATIAGGALGSDYFVAHAFGQGGGQVPGAIWAANLNGPLAQEQLVSYTAGASATNGIDTGATLRYERWVRGPDSNYRFNADLGARYELTNGVRIGFSALDLLHPDPFSGKATSLPSDTQLIGGVGYAGHHGSLESDWVYTKDHSYFRVGGEAIAPHGVALRAGFSDRDVSVGAGVKRGNTSIGVGAYFAQHQHTLYMGGVSARF